jgi:hypothetical protein
MDATAQLALMVKAKRVFESPGTFLSFPLAPMAYPPAVLDFSKALGDPKTGAALLEYSRSVNQCPVGAIFQDDSDQYLWERYDHWLNAMALAGGDLSADVQKGYDQAHALLTVTDADGLTTDSPVLSTYKQYRDSYFGAVQAYKSAQITAGSAPGAAAQAQWHDVDEPRLRQAVDQAKSGWETEGRKTEIEAAQNTVATCEARMPRKVWEAWRNAYNPDLDVYTDPASTGSCAPSGFAPADIGAQPWTNFVLTGQEIDTLRTQASSELQGIFGDTGASGIASLSFDFRSAAVVRPWFNSAMFDARFWKFADGSPDLSDGGTPPRGAWPGFVSAVVFVRNIRVTMPAAPPQPLTVLPAIAVRPQALKMMQAQRVATTAAPPARATAPVVVRAAPAMVARPTFAVAAAALRPAAPVPVRPAPAPAVNPVVRLNAAMLYRAPLTAAPPASAPAPVPTPPPPPPQPQPLPDDTISILAFICRPLRKVPDPDPALNWGA